MTKISYFVKGTLALVVDFLKKERKTTRGDQICLFIDGLCFGMVYVLLMYVIFRNVC